MLIAKNTDLPRPCSFHGVNWGLLALLCSQVLEWAGGVTCVYYSSPMKLLVWNFS